jgi:hypothetical protein
MALKWVLSQIARSYALLPKSASQRDVADHQVEEIDVDDEVAPGVGADVDGVLAHLDAAEMCAAIVAKKFVVIAGDVDDAGALTGHRSFGKSLQAHS